MVLAITDVDGEHLIHVKHVSHVFMPADGANVNLLYKNGETVQLDFSSSDTAQADAKRAFAQVAAEMDAVV